MTQFAQLKSQTAAGTSVPFPTDQYKNIVVSADHLAGAETVTLLMLAGTTNVAVSLPDGVTPATLTATHPSLPLPGGPKYVFTKSVTATACAVYVDTNGSA